MISLTYSYVKEGDIYTGWINELHGVVAIGDSFDDLESELYKILKVKFQLEKK